MARDRARGMLGCDLVAHRPHAERPIAQVATVRGRRAKLRYREVATNHA